MQTLNTLIVSLLLLSSSKAFLRNGWYRTHSKQPKMFIRNTHSFSDATIFKTDYLKIKSNHSILNLPQGAVKNLPKLEKLELTDCGIQVLTPKAFLNLPNLDKLLLQDNAIKEIPQGVFNELTITALYLQRNKIHKIDSKAFDDLPNLHLLKLNFNKINHWDLNWFKNTPQLTELYIRRNFITELPAKAFQNLHGTHLVKNKEVVDLKIYLSRNNITYLHPETFNGLTRLSQLWLDRNNLTELDSKLFVNLEHIDVLYLTRNKISELYENMFGKLEDRLETLDLANNRIVCLPFEVVRQVKYLALENNHLLDCQCVKNIKVRIMESGVDTSFVANSEKTSCFED